MESPQVTIIVVPQERFSYTELALESLYEHTCIPFSLVYVDGNSPARIQSYLEEQSQLKRFTLVRRDRYLTPNQARNIGLSYAKTKYVVFVDNDLVFTPNWLEKLINCAEETEATVVCPLICNGESSPQKVHFAGGEAHIIVETKGDEIIRKVYEEHYFVDNSLVEVQDWLQRRQSELAKFHCMLVRQDIFEEIGCLDEQLLNTKEHIDFCLSLTQAGGTIYCEPSSIVTHVTGKIEWSDLPFFYLRWNDDWESATLQHFNRKWNLTDREQDLQLDESMINWRYQTLFRPLLGVLSLGQTNTWLANSLKTIERSLNSYWIRRYKNNSIGF
ncbi:MAG: glycosyltransferase family 2 protein [Xenococcaceae cyanobacterium]